VQRPRGPPRWIQLGWLYVDSTCLLEKAADARITFVADVRDLAAVERLLAAGDVAGVLTELPNNPQLETADIPALRALRDRHGARLLARPELRRARHRRCPALGPTFFVCSLHEVRGGRRRR
jgi:cystathionine gamma-synthase